MKTQHTGSKAHAAFSSFLTVHAVSSHCLFSAFPLQFNFQQVLYISAYMHTISMQSYKRCLQRSSCKSLQVEASTSSPLSSIYSNTHKRCSLKKKDSTAFKNQTLFQRKLNASHKIRVYFKKIRVHFNIHSAYIYDQRILSLQRSSQNMREWVAVHSVLRGTELAVAFCNTEVTYNAASAKGRLIGIMQFTNRSLQVFKSSSRRSILTNAALFFK